MPCAPEHIELKGDEATIRMKSGELRVDAAIRFFPADWLPNLGKKTLWDPFFKQVRFQVSNPATSILIQSKRFPLVWDRLDTPLKTWRALLPETRGVADVPKSKQEEWVWKPAFGRVGESIGIAGVTEERELKLIKREAKRKPADWIVQRRFHALPVEQNGKAYYATIGVYTVDGRAAGAYARICDKVLINHESQDIAVLITGGIAE